LRSKPSSMLCCRAQAVVHPINPRRQMQRHRRPAQFGGRLDRHHLMSHRGKSGGIAPGAGPNIQDPGSA
jgi:hypothetical protein